DIDFIAAIGSVFVFPNVACHRMKHQAKRITMAHGKDFRQIAGFANKWVIGGIVPSSLRRRTLPARSFGSWAFAALGGSAVPTDMYTIPSLPNVMREALLSGTDVKMSFTSASPLPSQRPRASVMTPALFTGL